jgi:hypothetical protein
MTEEVKYLAKAAELTGASDLSEDAIELLENLRAQFEEAMRTIQEAINAMIECAEETEPATEKPTSTLFTDNCLFVTEKCKSCHYFSKARGPPERSEHNI